MTQQNMPETKKESPEDGFNLFVLDVEKKVKERGTAFINEMAASMWEHMKPDERRVYEEQAQIKKQNLCHVGFKKKCRPRRRYRAPSEQGWKGANRQIRMDRDIEETVDALKRQNLLKTHPFHLVHVNYYCKLASGRYLGCEIALAEFSFVDGVRKTYHTFINPGKIPLGYAFTALKHSGETHHFLPPDYYGSESDHLEIFKNIRLFLMGEDGDETKLPPLYTRPRDIDAVASVLQQMREGADPYMNTGRDSFRVYSVCKLFHELRNGILGVPRSVNLHPNFFDEEELVNDSLDYAKEISCYDHEEIEAMRNCSLSYVHRWSFRIMEECCGVLEIEIIPGKHCDFDTYLIKRAYLRSRTQSPVPLSVLNKCLEILMRAQEMKLVRSGRSPYFQDWLRRQKRPQHPLRRPREPLESILKRQEGRVV
jgi:protein maelstrom